MAAYKYFITSKDVLEFLCLKFLFVGGPRQGKSTTCRRVSKEIIDLMSAREEMRIHPSTGTVECCSSILVQNKFNTATSKLEAEWLVLKSLVDEACILFRILKGSLGTRNITPVASISSNVDRETVSESSQASSTVPSPQEECKQRGVFDTVKSFFHSIIWSTPKRSPPSPEHNPPPPKRARTAYGATKFEDYSEIAAIFNEVVQNPTFAEDLKHSIKALLRIEDTGGQPELMDIAVL